MTKNAFRIGDELSFSFDETDVEGALMITTDRSIYVLSASETLNLLRWLYERCDVIWQKSQEEEP
jgi:hypothetical protein